MTDKTLLASAVFLNTSMPLEFVDVIISPFIIILLSTSKLSTFVAPTLKKYPLAFALPIPTSALVKLPNLILLELLTAELSFKIIILPSSVLALMNFKLLLIYIHCAVPSLILNIGLVVLDTLHNEIPLIDIDNNIVSLLNDVVPLINNCLINIDPFVVLLHSI